jgi:hypothetical protein
MKNPFCYIGAHNWEYSREKHKVEGHPNNREFIRVVVRECKWCGHREHHLLPRINGKFGNWSNFDDISKDDTINFEKL